MQTGNVENRDGQRGSRWRIAAWAAAALVLALPLVAMQLTDDVNWTVADFVFAAALMLGVGVPFELAVRKTSDTAYRAAVGVALAAAFLLVWVNGAVGINDNSTADGMYFWVIVVGIIGASIARFKAHGMARAMFATALAQALVAAIALIAGMVPAYNSAFEIVALNGFFVALFVGSALLFRRAARGPLA